MKCSNCGMDSPQGVRYCAGCGSEIMAQPMAVQMAPQQLPMYYQPQMLGSTARGLSIAVGILKGGGVMALAICVFIVGSIFNQPMPSYYTGYNPLAALYNGAILLGIALVIFSIAEFIKPFTKKN